MFHSFHEILYQHWDIFYYHFPIIGPRFQTSTHGFFSMLLILDVSKNDGGNITCVAKERNITISLKGRFENRFFYRNRDF